MTLRQGHDGPPPQHWPDHIIYLTKSRLAPSFPSDLLPLLYCPSPSPSRFIPRAVAHPAHVTIKPIKTPGHPANGQYGLFAKRRIGPCELIIPYLGVIHHSLVQAEPDATSTADQAEEDESDYDLSLVRLSAYDTANPRPGYHISIGVDAAKAGNAARFVNDYRGIAAQPNAEFRLGEGETGEARMEIWSLKSGVAKGDEILVSYGKAWWGARKDT